MSTTARTFSAIVVKPAVSNDIGKHLFGLEVELGFAARGENGCQLPHDEALLHFFQLCSRRLIHLRTGSRMFLANGSLVYPDVGHPELATAESSSPVALLQALRAGERMLTGIAEELDKQKDVESVVLFRANVDYLEGTTWGCHESYLSRNEPSTFANQVVPHLASRIVFSGVGGFGNCFGGMSGAKFVLSPRALHLTVNIGPDVGRGARAIFSLRDERLSSGDYHRVHLICGEPNCAELSTYLKIGTTSLVLAMADAGIDLGYDKKGFKSAVTAMRRLTFDPDCNRKVECHDQTARSAVMIQRHYLELAEQHCNEPFMPAWAEEVCIKWRDVLDKLETDPEQLAGVIDWPTKLKLFRHYTRTHSNLSWDTLPICSSVSQRAQKALEIAKRPMAKINSGAVNALIRGKGELARLFINLTDVLDNNGLTWDEMDEFESLRHSLYELDLRYGQLYPKGIFLNLEEAGEFSGRVLEQQQIDEALERAPAPGRARVRGDWVRQLAGNPGQYDCGWTGIRGRQGLIDLGNPFVTEARWTAETRPRANRQPDQESLF